MHHILFLFSKAIIISLYFYHCFDVVPKKEPPVEESPTHTLQQRLKQACPSLARKHFSSKPSHDISFCSPHIPFSFILVQSFRLCVV